VTYAKFVANAAWAGLHTTLLLAALLVLINGVPPGGSAASALGRATLSLAPVYVPGTALALATLFVFLRFFAVRRLRARWQSFKAIVWFGTAATGWMTAVAYLNLRWIGGLISPAAREALRSGSALLAAGFLLSAALASLGQFRTGQEARRLRILAVVALTSPLLFLWLAAPRGVAPPPAQERTSGPLETIPAEGGGTAGGRMLLIGVDAASMDQLLPLAAAGELPAFDRLMRRGASSRLNTLRPCAPAVAWAALLTGRPPWRTGLRGTHLYTLPLGPADLGLLPRAMGISWLRHAGYITSRPVPAPPWRDHAVWDEARSAGLDEAVIGWEGDLALSEQDPRVASRVARIVGEGEGEAAPRDDARLLFLRRAVARDLAARDAVLASLREGRPRLVAVRFAGLSDVVRRYLRYHAPAEFGDLPAAQKDPREKIVSGYYEFLDEVVAEMSELAGEDRIIVVVSPHGVEPVPAWERTLDFMGFGRGDVEVSGSWRRGPDGVFLIAGPGVQPGARPEEVDLLDVAPTAAYLLGLPIDREMRGSLLRRLLLPEFLEAHPVHFVPAGEAMQF
jgi:hypothetical protein